MPAEVRRLTGGAGAQVVFDAVGGVMFEPALLSLDHRGRLVEISGTCRRRVEFDVVDFYHNEGRIFGADSRKLDIAGSAKLLADLVPGFESGAYAAPVIAATYPLEEACAAYEAVANGRAGRVVITPRRPRLQRVTCPAKLSPRTSAQRLDIRDRRRRPLAVLST